MLQFTIEADVDAAVRALDFVRTEQIPFAASLALNLVAKAARDSVRDSLQDKYHDRGGSLAFLRQGVRVAASTKSDLAATVYDADWFMGYQEAGGDKTAHGSEPQDWMGIRGASIAGVRFPPSAVALLAQHGSGYLVQQFPATGTWFLGHRYLNGAADRRDATGARSGNAGFSVVMLLEQQVRVQPTFGMRETVEQTVATGFNEAFEEALQRAVATARESS